MVDTSDTGGVLRIAALAGALALLSVAAFAGIPAVVIRPATCAGQDTVASAAAGREIPPRYLAAYRQAGQAYAVPWRVLAGIGAVETDHGRSDAPGVHTGLNRYGCCAGPMQFNLTDGPPSTWARYRVDADHDGSADVYDPEDALLQHADGNLPAAILGYNHSPAYVNDVLARARDYTGEPLDAPHSSLGVETGARDAGGLDAPAGPAELSSAVRLDAPLSYTALPAWAMAAGPLARAGRHAALPRRHLDPAPLPLAADRRARSRTPRPRRRHRHRPGPRRRHHSARLGRVHGAIRARPRLDTRLRPSGSRPACPLAPAIQFIGYDGYPGHGSPHACSGGCHPHLHVSWVSPCYGSRALAAPCEWIGAFPLAAQ